jgi:hypothetical protein
MLRYMQVPLGSTVMIWFPRILNEESGEPNEVIESTYRYQLRWRLRSLQDRLASKNKMPYVMPGMKGASTHLSDNTTQWVVPATLGDVIEPVLPTNYNDALSLNHAGEFMADSQGLYGHVFPSFPNVSRGPLFYPPTLIPAVGNELAIYAYRETGEGYMDWDFLATDIGFSNYYGVGVGGVKHPWYPMQGIYVATMGRSTFP